MMRSPKSASATSRDRTPSGGISKASTSPSAVPSTSAGAIGELPDLGQELAGALLDDRRHVAEARRAARSRRCPTKSRTCRARACRFRTAFRRAGVSAQGSEPAQSIDLFGRQGREGFVVARDLRLGGQGSHARVRPRRSRRLGRASPPNSSNSSTSSGTSSISPSSRASPHLSGQAITLLQAFDPAQKGFCRNRRPQAPAFHRGCRSGRTVTRATHRRRSRSIRLRQRRAGAKQTRIVSFQIRLSRQ